MLKAVPQSRTNSALSRVRFAIVASKYNRKYVDGMLREAKSALARAGTAHIDLVRVPGAFEIPAVAAKLASATTRPCAAILCLGVILRGETSHAQHIGEAISHALAQIQVLYRIPIIHEVLLFENEEQARVRCLSRTHNRGAEAAHTALEMARTMARLRNA